MPVSGVPPGTPTMISGVTSVLLRSAPTPAAKSLRALTSDTMVSEAGSDAVTLKVTRTDVLTGVVTADDAAPVF